MSIKTHRPWLCPLAIVLIIVVMVSTGLLLCQHSLQLLGHTKQVTIEQQVREQEQKYQQIQAVQQNNASLMAQNQELRNKLATIIRTTQASQETYTQVLQSLSDTQIENQDLTEELNFYRALLRSAPQTNTRLTHQVKVNSFNIQYDETNQHYFYQLVLTQWDQAAKPAQGQLQIQAQGQLHSINKQLNMKQITLDNKESQHYQIHYFKKLTGYLQFPKDFIPKQITIRLIPAQQKSANEIHFQWSHLLNKEQL